MESGDPAGEPSAGRDSGSPRNPLAGYGRTVVAALGAIGLAIALFLLVAPTNGTTLLVEDAFPCGSVASPEREKPDASRLDDAILTDLQMYFACERELKGRRNTVVLFGLAGPILLVGALVPKRSTVTGDKHS